MQNGRTSGLIALKALLGATAAAVPSVLAAGPASAAEPQQEIVVTAQKREQSLIDVPAAITAIGGQAIQQQNLANVPAIASQVPNFSVTYGQGPNGPPDFNIRGVTGDQLASRLNESSVAIYTDDVYLGNEDMLNGALFDLQRVEVLRGPQGTLFGRNTTAGLVHFISAGPTRALSAYGTALYGSNDAVQLEGGIGGPLGQGLRARLSGKWDRSDGYLANNYLGAGRNGIPTRLGGRNLWGVRGIVDADLGPGTVLRLIGGYTESHSQTTPINALGTLKPGTPFAATFTRAQQCSPAQIYAAQCISNTLAAHPADLPNTRDPVGAISSFTSDQTKAIDKGKLATVKLTHALGWATLTGIGNYTRNYSYNGLDASGGSTPTIGQETAILQPRINWGSQYSGELRLNGSTKAFDWVAGIFYYADRKRSAIITNVANGVLLAEADAATRSHSYAVFGQLDNHLTDQVTFTIGARYTGDVRELTGATVYDNRGDFQDVRAYMVAHGLAVRANNHDVTGKLGLSWEPSHDDTYYLSLSRGIKGAGFNGGFSPTNVSSANAAVAAAAQASNAAVAGPVPQEVLDAAEIGAKNRFFDRKLSINSALFLYRYTGKQVNLTTLDPATNTTQMNYINVGTARVWGVETEVRYRPDRHWDLGVAAAYTGNKITRSSVVVRDNYGVATSLEGKHLINTPKYTVNTTLAYHLPTAAIGRFTLQGELYYKGSWNSSLVNDPLAQVPSYYLTNVRLLWESASGRYEAQVFVTNAFARKYPLITVDSAVGSQGKLYLQEGQPRQWGVKAGFHF